MTQHDTATIIGTLSDLEETIVLVPPPASAVPPEALFWRNLRDGILEYLQGIPDCALEPHGNVAILIGADWPYHRTQQLGAIVLDTYGIVIRCRQPPRLLALDYCDPLLLEQIRQQVQALVLDNREYESQLRTVLQ